jgi:hypothetical protein
MAHNSFPFRMDIDNVPFDYMNSTNLSRTNSGNAPQHFSSAFDDDTSYVLGTRNFEIYTHDNFMNELRPAESSF